MEFKPKKVICLLRGDSFKYTCKNIHLDSQGHEVCNTYRFVGKPLLHLIRNQEDYDELISLDNFEDYGEEEVKEETKKEKKAREKAEKKAEEIPIKEQDESKPELEAEEILENEDTVPEVE